MLNGVFTIQGSDYWRIEDVDRMQREMEDGTYSPLAVLRRFDIAVNTAVCDQGAVRRLVEALNGTTL